LNNLFIDIGERYISHDPKTETIEYDTLGYAFNVFNGQSQKIFGRLGRDADFLTLNDWIEHLKSKNVMVTSTGEEINSPQVKDARGHNFDLRGDSICIDKARKVFVPWALYAEAGEWHFYKHRADITKILDEHINWNKDWESRERVREGCTPRHDLIGYNISENNFKVGILENWIEGAVQLDGKSQYFKLDAENCGLLDMGTNNFLIVTVLLVEKNEADGSIVSKIDNDRGYSLLLNKGKIKMMIKSGNEVCFRESAQSINDGNWHHIIAEVDRNQDDIKIYIDGKLSNGIIFGKMIKDSLSNRADFVCGMSEDKAYLAGIFDFLRISRGTLSDAETTIEELYNWEFRGPFLKDFYGREMVGKSRDIGAVEYK